MGPYGITQVDVPGILGAYQSARQGRMQEMLFQRQMAREDRQEETDIKRQSALARVFQPKGTQQRDDANRSTANMGGGGLSAVPQQMPGGMAQAPIAPQALLDPAQLPRRTDGIELNPEAMRALYQIDPKGAMEIQTMFYNAEKGDIERAQQNGETMFKAATILQDLPPEERQAAFQQMAPQLRNLGIPDEQLAQVDLSDAGLRNYATLGDTLANVSNARKPVSMSPGEVMMDPATGQVVMRSPEPRIVVGADGVQYAVTQGGVAPVGQPSSSGIARPQSKADYDAIPNGTQYIGPDNQIYTKGGATPSASGNFR